MKTLLFMSVLLFILRSWASPNDLFIEIGQDHFIKKSVSRIWVESSKIISVEAAAGGIKIKSLLLGATRLRINDETFQVYVVPIGSVKTFRDWNQLTKKFIDLQVDYCLELVCLKGQIYRFTEFEKIIRLMSEKKSILYLAFDIHPSIQTEVDRFLEKFQRSKGLTPLRVMYATPWKVLYTNKETGTDYRSELARIGILALESKQKVEIADNIKVAIQVTEIKKEFGRSLGIKYPGAYSAQQISGQQLPIELALIASETEGNVKILASPNLLCRSGKEAEFFAGGEFPIRILNFKVNDVVWKKYGIGLKIKPQIDAIGQMSLQIDSEISSLDTANTVDGIPGLHTHRVSSYFDLIKSRTIALSGLIKNEQGQTSEGLPFLRQIPILGRLFSSDSFRESRTELVIFVTPELMKAE